MTYSIPLLLEGKLYRSRSLARRGLEGTIQRAEKREDVWNYSGLYRNDDEWAYAVQVRPYYVMGQPQPDFWATVFVDTSL